MKTFDVLKFTIVTGIISQRTLDCYRVGRITSHATCSECGALIPLDPVNAAYAPMRATVTRHVDACERVSLL